MQPFFGVVSFVPASSHERAIALLVFFMPAWVNAFVNGHSSQAALDEVNRFLEEYSGLTIDIRRKTLQSLDSLQRAVRIRRRFQ